MSGRRSTATRSDQGLLGPELARASADAISDRGHEGAVEWLQRLSAIEDAARSFCNAIAALKSDVGAGSPTGSDSPIDDPLVGASDRPFGLSPGEFRRLAKAGAFPTREGGRGRLEAFRSDVRRALKEEMRGASALGAHALDDDPLRDAIASGRLVEAKRRG